MGSRRQPRTPVGLMVRVSGVDANGNPFVQTAYARDVSPSGARLDGLALFEAPGQTITVEYKGRNAKFLVVWVGEPGRREQGQIGIRSLDSSLNIWKLDLPRIGPDNFRGEQRDLRESAPPAPAATQVVSARSPSQSGDRRRRPRYRCVETNVEFCAPGADVGMSGKLTDISLTGCYIEVLTPCLKGTALEIVLRHQGTIIQLPGSVITVHPGMGMGIEFDRITGQNSIILASLIEAIRATAV